MNLPITMQGGLDACLLLALSTPLDDVAHIPLPPPLRLVTHRGHAFWNLVVCHIDKMRPMGVPRALGMSYHHVAYRFYVTVDTPQGPVSGLYFLHSQADNRLIGQTGNLVSNFRFHYGPVELHERDGAVRASGQSAGNAVRDGFLIRGQCQQTGPTPLSNLFESRAQALACLKYQPFGLAVGRGDRVRLAEVLRNESLWMERDFCVEEMRWNYLEAMGQHRTRLELATWVAPLPYRWRLGHSVQGLRG